MPPDPAKFFNPQGPDRVAVVWAEAAGAGLYLVRLARGVRTGKLTKGTAYGPYAEADLADRFADLAAGLRGEGFLPSGMHALLDALAGASPERRGKAALRVGWAGGADLVPTLIAALANAVDDLCPIVDALGMLGDPRAIPAIRPLAARKLLSRRRSAVEALRNLGDVGGLAEARQRALEQLPDNVRDALLVEEQAYATPPVPPEAVARVVAAVKAADPQRHGLCADLLYEIASPVAVDAARALLAGFKFDQPFVWRYVKSVLKRAMLRHDYLTFGWIVHEVEAQGRQTTGTKAVVKSGYDGVDRTTRIFGHKTRDYLRRAAWRYLRLVAQYRPARYPFAAAAALIPYTPDDAAEPSKLYGALSRCYLLNRILRDGGKRYELKWGAMRFRLRKGLPAKPPPGLRQEAYPALWDAHPQAYLRLLGAAKLIDVQEWAFDAVRTRHLDVLRAAPEGQILPMLDAPFEPTVNLALSELERRFDPAKPDWPLLLRLASETRAAGRDLGHKWLRQSVGAWSAEAEKIAALLTVPEPATRALVADLAIEPLRSRPDVRRQLAPLLLALLRNPPAAASPWEPGSADVRDPIARVCREALADELAELLTVDDLLGLIAGDVPAVQAVAADLLGRYPDAVERLGLPRITAMAQHPLAAVRSAAGSLLRGAERLWQADPSVLLVLAESEWADTRAVALDLLDRLPDFDRLGFEGLVGLLDSNRTDVQDRGVVLARRHLAAIDPAALVERLVQHPHPNVRQFALELATRHLPDGPDALAKVEPLCRSALFDTRPQVATKRGVAAFLRDRGLRDADQARIAARVLGDFARTQGLRDMERVLAALVRIKLAHPEVDVPITLPAELAAAAAPAGQGGVA